VPAGFEVQYRQVVLEQDLLRLPRNVRTRVIRAVETRLVTEPQKYGQRLRRSLLGQSIQKLPSLRRLSDRKKGVPAHA
jgi:hypothetical protein